MSDLVQLRLGKIFGNLRQSVEGFRDVVLVEGATILKREEMASIRARWFRTGATLASLKEETVTDGSRKTYRLYPTAVSAKGAPYPLFGEYGTGRRGSTTGRPAPRGYRYGEQAGMAARRYSRIAVERARPQIAMMSAEQARRFARNMTTR